MVNVLSTAMHSFCDNTHAMHTPTCDEFPSVQQPSQANTLSQCAFQHLKIFPVCLLSLNYKECKVNCQSQHNFLFFQRLKNKKYFCDWWFTSLHSYILSQQHVQNKGYLQTDHIVIGESSAAKQPTL
jgi:hypothetical protein